MSCIDVVGDAIATVQCKTVKPSSTSSSSRSSCSVYDDVDAADYDIKNLSFACWTLAQPTPPAAIFGYFDCSSYECLQELLERLLLRLFKM